MAQPQNERLWNMLVAQARSKFVKYPSLPASKWVHDEYVKKGGQFVESAKDSDESKDKRDKKTSHTALKGNAAAKRHKERAKKRGRAR